MKLIYRYKKLSFWNKLSVWGSIASILGIMFFFIPTENTDGNTQIQTNIGTVVNFGKQENITIGGINNNAK